MRFSGVFCSCAGGTLFSLYYLPSVQVHNWMFEVYKPQTESCASCLSFQLFQLGSTTSCSVLTSPNKKKKKKKKKKIFFYPIDFPLLLLILFYFFPPCYVLYQNKLIFCSILRLFFPLRTFVLFFPLNIFICFFFSRLLFYT